MTASKEHVLPGTTLGRYELIHEIASGGMATVYVARVRGVAGFERIVAIKCCHPHLRREEEFADMFLDEARLAARIHHPNVVPTLDVGEAENGSLFLVMDLVDGFSLAQLNRTLTRDERTMPVPVALRIMIDALSGLHAAHELRDANDKPLNLVHRDISPQNVLVGADGVARITDFGVAKAEARLASTREGLLKGKLSYMAPEQIGLNPSLTRQADLYPAGVVLWELLAGARLFDGRSDAETLNLVLRGAVRAPSSLRDDVGADVDAIVFRALERDTAKRFETALEFADALESCSTRPATARAVGMFIQESLEDAFQRRRDLLRRCLDASPIVIERPPANTRSEAPNVESERQNRSAMSTKRSPRVGAASRRRRRVYIAGFGASATVIALGMASMRFVRPASPTPSMQPRIEASIAPRATAEAPARVVYAMEAPEPSAQSSFTPNDRDASVAMSPSETMTTVDAAVVPANVRHHVHHDQRDSSAPHATPGRFTPHSI